jgi:DNA-binding NarL/FixJ family response regulator
MALVIREGIIGPAVDRTGVRLSVLGNEPIGIRIRLEMARTVLIVDDHPSFRASARMLLEAEGFDVIGEAEDGAGALEAVRELAPQVILLDVQLPDFDGFEVAARLTANGASPAIVLTSSRDVNDLGPLGEREDVRGFIPKSELSGAALEALLG